MRVIVEGPDGAGKTTLVTLLEEFFGIEKQPRAVGKDAKSLTDMKVWVESDLEQDVDAPGALKLYDRHALISGPIYSPLLHKGRLQHPWDNEDWTVSALSMFWAQHPYVIYCLPPEKVVHRNIRDSGHEQPQGLKSDAKVYWLYWQYYGAYLNNRACFPMHAVKFDYTLEASLASQIGPMISSIREWNNAS